jgi:hypothetical protein
VIVYLIGGGPSCAEIDTAALTGGLRIGINDAAFHKPVDAFFSNDHGYALRSRDAIEALTVPAHLAIRIKHQPLFDGWKATVWTRRDNRQPCINPGELSSGPAGTPGCSGYVALNLAAQFGARRIVLFGYDFHADYRYFFAEDPYPRIEISGVIKSFADVAPWYERQGIEIVNANPNSAIKAFAFADPETIFAQDRDHRRDRQAGAG